MTNNTTASNPCNAITTDETCDPGNMWGVCPRQPVRWDTVVQPKSIEADLEGTQMQRSMCLGVAGRWRLVDEQRRWTVATGFHKNRLGQLKHEMCRCFTRLVGQTWHDTALVGLVTRRIHTSQLAEWNTKKQTKISSLKQEYHHCDKKKWAATVPSAAGWITDNECY